MGHSVVTNEGITSSLTMKVMGLFAITYAVCLLGMVVSQPLFFPEPISTATFTAAGGLVLAGATGTTLATIPTSAILLGKGLLLKKALLAKALLAQSEEAPMSHGHGRR